MYSRAFLTWNLKPCDLQKEKYYNTLECSSRSQHSIPLPPIILRLWPLLFFPNSSGLRRGSGRQAGQAVETAGLQRLEFRQRRRRPGKVGAGVPRAMTAAGEGGEGGCHGCGRVSAMELQRDPTALRAGQRTAVKRWEEDEGVKSKNRVFSGL